MADRQHGVVARRQLARLGLGRGAIDNRVARGRLHVVHPGVYAVGHSVLSAHGRRLAAVLACGPGAVVSHRGAADLWALLRSDSARIDVTVPGHGRRGPGGAVVLHRARRFRPADRADVERIPVTSVARTLLDLAGVLDRGWLERAIEAAERRGRFDSRAVAELLARARGHRGAALLRAALGEYREPSFTRSGFERRFLALCRKAGLPQPAANLWIAGGRPTPSGSTTGSSSNWTATASTAPARHSSATDGATPNCSSRATA